eukprot:GFUD01087228.1.p1 GENE.GFUD01087228.1~~GFUD01087228.1.p1  ORF type:complete len:155 (-),score=39.15 GFUD01087228.1:16-480(-)
MDYLVCSVWILCCSSELQGHARQHYLQGQVADYSARDHSLMFPFLPMATGGVDKMTSQVSRKIESSAQLQHHGLLGMTPFHRTLPFQLAWNTQPDHGGETHPAHPIKMSRQPPAVTVNTGPAQLTAGQMLKILKSSISNRGKQAASKEVKWGFR